MSIKLSPPPDLALNRACRRWNLADIAANTSENVLFRLAFTKCCSEARQLSANRCLHSLGFLFTMSNVGKNLLRGNWIVRTCKLMKSSESTPGCIRRQLAASNAINWQLRVKVGYRRVCWVQTCSSWASAELRNIPISSCYPCRGRWTPRLCKLILLIFSTSGGFSLA